MGISFSGKSISRKTLEVEFNITKKSIVSIENFCDNFYRVSSRETSSRLQHLSEAKKLYPYAICYLSQINEWEAFIEILPHSDKARIHLRVFRHYFRTIEEFIDSILIKKLGVKRKHIVVKISELLPDKNFAPLFIENNLLLEILFSALTLSCSIVITYFKFSHTGQYDDWNLLYLVALVNFKIFLDSAKRIYLYKGRPWIKI